MALMHRKILAFDGGPSPTVSIRVLKKIEEQFPGFLNRVDLFAGTSHGGIISLKLATLLSNGVPAARAIDECISFDDEFLGLFKLCPTRLLRMLSGVLPMLGSRDMLIFLEKHFTDSDGNLLRMRDLKKPVSVSAFDLNIGALRTANTFAPQSADITLLSAALACSSFPVMMPFFRPSTDALPIVDAGFGANSGAMPALMETLLYMHASHRDASMGDFLPYITLLSMGALSKDRPLKIPLFEPLAQFAEMIGLFGQETEVKGGGILRSAGWWFLLRNNVKVVLTLLENTQALDKDYAGILLDRKRYRRTAPALELLDFLWLLFIDLDAALGKADALADEYWAAQMKEYESRKANPMLPPHVEFQGDNELACWIDKYWAHELAPAAAASPSLSSLAGTDMRRDSAQ